MTSLARSPRRLPPSSGRKGAYPSGNSLVVRGSSESLIIDPSVTVVEMGGTPEPVDAVLNSHGHEDHIAGNGTFPDARVRIHEQDLPAAKASMACSTFTASRARLAASSATKLIEEFSYTPRPDAEGFTDGDIFDLGGVTVEAVHLPGPHPRAQRLSYLGWGLLPVRHRPHGVWSLLRRHLVGPRRFRGKHS